jgi:hypothetical protein
MQLSESATSSDDNDGPFGVNVLAADRLDTTSAPTVDGSEIEQQDLIFAMIDQGAQCRDHRNALDRREIAPKHGVLDVIAEAAQRLEHAIAAVVVTYVICNDVAAAHATS